MKDEYKEIFGRKELAPYLFSEICVIDMISAVTKVKSGYYLDRLVLKGGLSVRNHVPLKDHRFSFDADYNPNAFAKYTFGDVDELAGDIRRYSNKNGCETLVKVTKDNAELYFVEFDYRGSLRKRGCELVEPPKIELCKRCRTFQKPVKNSLNTFIDLELLGLKSPVVYHVALEEQLATKLFIIGAVGRQRNNFDAYDAARIAESNKINWKLARELFEQLVKRHRRRPKDRIAECRRHLDTMLKNDGKRRSLEQTIFQEGFDYDEMVRKVKSMYDFAG